MKIIQKKKEDKLTDSQDVKYFFPEFFVRENSGIFKVSQMPGSVNTVKTEKIIFQENQGNSIFSQVISN